MEDIIMKITMYGTEICPDCVEAKIQLSKLHEIQLDYRSITESTSILKEFLNYRDHDPLFKPIVKEGYIGIPFFILENGTKTFDIKKYVALTEDKISATSCSIDGKGQC